jgi:hypothetical protein
MITAKTAGFRYHFDANYYMIAYAIAHDGSEIQGACREHVVWEARRRIVHHVDCTLATSGCESDSLGRTRSLP